MHHVGQSPTRARLQNLGRVADRDHGDHVLVVGHAENRPDLPLGEPGHPASAEAQTGGLEHQVLDGDRHVADHLLQLRQSAILIERRAAVIRNPAPDVAHAGDMHRGLEHPRLAMRDFGNRPAPFLRADDDEVPGLSVAARRRQARGFEDLADGRLRHGLGGVLANAATVEDRLQHGVLRKAARGW